MFNDDLVYIQMQLGTPFGVFLDLVADKVSFSLLPTIFWLVYN
jgi:phosphatidylglycerophosphate synthase